MIEVFAILWVISSALAIYYRAEAKDFEKAARKAQRQLEKNLAIQDVDKRRMHQRLEGL